MADVVLVPTRGEFDGLEAEYDALARELEAHGFEVELRRPGPRRGIEHTAVDLLVQVGEFALERIDEVLVGLIVAKLSGLHWRRKQEAVAPRRVAILGPDGKPLKEFELPDDDG
jgi:hypothetical protein